MVDTKGRGKTDQIGSALSSLSQRANQAPEIDLSAMSEEEYSELVATAGSTDPQELGSVWRALKALQEDSERIDDELTEKQEKVANEDKRRNLDELFRHMLVLESVALLMGDPSFEIDEQQRKKYTDTAHYYLSRSPYLDFESPNTWSFSEILKKREGEIPASIRLSASRAHHKIPRNIIDISADFAEYYNILKSLTEFESTLVKEFGFSASEAKEKAPAAREAILALKATSPLSLPKAPPKYAYTPRMDGGIIRYLEDNWAEHIKAGLLDRSNFRRIDPAASQALTNWLRNNTLPEHLYIPTKTEVIDQQLEQHGGMEQVRRLADAARHRLKRAGPNEK